MARARAPVQDPNLGTVLPVEPNNQEFAEDKNSEHSRKSLAWFRPCKRSISDTGN